MTLKSPSFIQTILVECLISYSTAACLGQAHFPDWLKVQIPPREIDDASNTQNYEIPIKIIS